MNDLLIQFYMWISLYIEFIYEILSHTKNILRVCLVEDKNRSKNFMDKIHV